LEQTPINKFNKPNLSTDLLTDDKFWKENWDIAETKFNDVDKVLDLARLNSLYLSKFYKKMQNADTAPIGNDVVITCQGDSMTAGNGATTGNDFPNVLKSQLTSIARAGQTITVVNRGIGGNTTQMSYEAWSTPSTGDLCIIFLGTNDFNININMDTFSSYYQKIIEREIRAGVGVVLITPHKWRKADWMTKANNGSIADYVAVIKNFGNKYNAPVLDLHAESRNLDITAYKTGEADPGIHFSDVGYKLLANKLTALLGFQHPSTLPVVVNNSFLSVRPSIDGIKESAEYYIMHTSASYPTASEFNSDGIGLIATSTERTVHYSFYVAEDNLAIIPSFFFTENDGTEKFEMVINNNCMPYHDNNLYQYNSTVDRTLPPTSTLLTMSNFQSGHANSTITQNFFVKPSTYFYRYFPVKGWYTVRIKLKNCRLHGFDFLNTNQMKIYRELCATNPDIITRY
jgi:lysophospholipase L1-like esterase